MNAVRVVAACGILGCAIVISAFGQMAQSACPGTLFGAPVPTTGGRPTALDAARWFARESGPADLPATGWHLTRQTATAATAVSAQRGGATLHVIRVSDGTWQVAGGTACD